MISYTQPAQRQDSIIDKYVIIKAGKQYERKASFQKSWGAHYRKEWATPVKVKIAYLDTLAGGLKPYQRGGGRQTKNLRLRDTAGREYVLRSIDKRFGNALPEIYRGTFLEPSINDQVSIAHPYAAITISPMAEAAKLYHTNPEILFIPEQKFLDSFNKDFANELYLFEQRPDENWETASNFGNSKNIISTEKLLELLLKDNANRVDQLAFIRARLFDFIIGDWGRHEDQWRWAEFTIDDEIIFKPIPRDRDQAYTKFDGKLLRPLLLIAGLKHLETFDTTIKNVTTFNWPARYLDRRITNEPSLAEWVDIAEDIQRLLTDNIIEQAVRGLPPEVFPISGEEIIIKLKSRRNHLAEFATAYYKFLAKAVDITGTEKKELFTIKRLNDEETMVEVYRIKSPGNPEQKPIYNRKFFTSETKEIRLYGMGDDDVFHLDGSTGKGILIRIIGGEGNDLLLDSSTVAGRKKLNHVYDTEKSGFHPSDETRLYISNDSSMNAYEYSSFKYDEKGLNVKPGFFSITLGFGKRVHQWRKEPAGYEQSIRLKYSINRAAVNIEYNRIFYQALGKWNIGFTAGAGVPSVVNFFGIGNESSFPVYDRRYFRLRSHEYYGKVGINRFFGGKQMVELNGFYQTIKILQDTDRFISDFVHSINNGFHTGRKHFVGGESRYTYRNTDDPVVPVKGFSFQASAVYTYNLNTPGLSFARLESGAAVYIPVFKFISLAFRAGGATNSNDAEFYQLNRLGSDVNLRGYRKQRFYGRHSFYSNNEFRLIFNTKNKIFNGKIGLIGFYDTGRVWQPGEQSDTWHAGYGPGAFLSLFNKVIVSAAYGFSKEDRNISAYFGFYF